MMAGWSRPGQSIAVTLNMGPEWTSTVSIDGSQIRRWTSALDGRAVPFEPGASFVSRARRVALDQKRWPVD
jgi:hypothetical protein